MTLSQEKFCNAWTLQFHPSLCCLHPTLPVKMCWTPLSEAGWNIQWSNDHNSLSARKIPPEFGESYNYETVTKATINNAQMFMSILSLSNVISKRAEHRISKSILMSLLLLLLHVVFFNCNIYTVLLCLHVLACTSSRWTLAVWQRSFSRITRCISTIQSSTRHRLHN